MKKYAIIIVLIILNITLLGKYFFQRNQIILFRTLLDNSIKLAISFPKFELLDVLGKACVSDAVISSAPYSLFIFFSPLDCSTCVSEVEWWMTLYKRRTNYNIIGIVSHSNLQELRDWINNLGIKFPVIYDDAGIFTLKFAARKTPFKVLANRKSKVLLIEGESYTKLAKKLFLKRFYKLINVGDKGDF